MHIDGITPEMSTDREDLKQDGETNLICHLDPVWPRIARDRRLWKQFREGSERNPGRNGY